MIKEIQKKIGVTADGMVGPKTRDAAKKALANGTITNEEMYELSGDQYKPNPFIPGSMTTLNGDDYVPNKETGDVQENPFIAGSMTKLNGQSYIPEQFEKKENPISVGDGRNWNADVEIKDVPKVENKTGIMALLNPLDSPDYMGSKLYLKNERENYAKAIGGTPVISKVFQGIDYSNSDVKDLMDSAMDDVQTQEAMKKAQNDNQSTAISNVRAMVDQNLQAANQLSGELMEDQRNMRTIQTGINNNNEYKDYYAKEMKANQYSGQKLDENGRALGTSEKDKKFNDAYDNYWKLDSQNKSLEASMPDVSTKSNMRTTMLDNAKKGAKLLGIDFGDVYKTETSQPIVTQQDQSHLSNTFSNENSNATKTESSGKNTGSGKSGGANQTPKSQDIRTADDSTLLNVATSTNYQSFMGSTSSQYASQNQGIAKANFEEKKAAAIAEIGKRINSISTPEQLEKMYKVYGSSFPDLFEKRMSVYSEDHSDKSTRMKRKYNQLSRGL